MTEAPSPSWGSSVGDPGARLAALRTVIGTARGGNRFYAERLRGAGVDETIESLEAFCARMPFTTKADLAEDQAAAPPYGTNLSYGIERYARLHQTSSTSGQRPLRWLDTPEDWAWMTDGWVQVLEAAGATASDRVLVAFSFGPFIGLWLGFDAAKTIGCLTIPGGAMDSANRLRILLEHEATVLCCTPTYALRLGEVARDTGVDLGGSSVRSIVVGGEPGASVSGTRRRMKDLWPTAHLYDHYGMTEIGPATYQCPERPDAVHVLDSLLCEVIDPDSGAPVDPADGVAGELVFTTLGRAGSPVLRYRTGDLARPLPLTTCACGRRTLQLEGGVIGRADDMVVVRGVNMYPSVVDEIVRGVPGITEYRVEIDTSPALPEIHVQIEPDDTTDGRRCALRQRPGGVPRRVQPARADDRRRSRLAPALRAQGPQVDQAMTPRRPAATRRFLSGRRPRTAAPPRHRRGCDARALSLASLPRG